MIEVERTATIAAPVDEVWDVVADPTRAPDWYSFGDRVDVLSGDGVGEKRRQHGRYGMQRSEVDQEIVEFTPRKVVAWKETGERRDGKPAPRYSTSTVFRIELSPFDDGTIVTLTSRQRPAGLIGAVVIRVLGARDIARRMEESLIRLARAIN